MELSTTNGFINLTDLTGNTEYEIKVGNVCDNSLVGYSQLVRLRTKETGTDLNVNCGEEPVIDLSNKMLIQKLSVYDVVTATDFPITITRVEGNANGWSGDGWVRVPYLGDAKIHVVFNGIKVNTDYKLIDGYFETTYNPTGKNIADIDQTTSDIKGLVNDLKNTLSDLLSLNDLVNKANYNPPELLGRGNLSATNPKDFRFVLILSQPQARAIRTFTNTVGHELGHAVFGLQHPFHQTEIINKGYRQGADPDNFMDYQDGHKSRKYQWNQIHYYDKLEKFKSPL